MRIAMLCFSLTGYRTGKRLEEGLKNGEREIFLDQKSRYLENSITESHTEWTGRQFRESDAIIFIGACGIAVRGIAPYVKNKKTDPAVLVVDECGKYVISLLSGHLGGANDLAEETAKLLGAVPVITTATDLHKRFAVDVFAKKNDCDIYPLRAVKVFSSTILAGEKVGFYSDYEWSGKVPEGVAVCDREGRSDTGERLRLGMAVTIDRACQPFPYTVWVIPRIVTLGIGCRKGKSGAAIQSAAQEALERSGMFREALQGIASIDLKKEEQGILRLAEQWKLPFVTYTEEELRNVPGDFEASEFVKQITGVDNVCERSAVLASGQGNLIQRKHGADGVTTALAVRDWRMYFE